MKIMKKFGLLVALALIVTVGGVYATWSYAASSEVGAVETPLTIQMVNYEEVGGAITLLTGSGITVAIDDTTNDHVAELVLSGSMVFIFKPAGTTTEESVESMLFDLTLSANSTDATNWEYEDSTSATKPIFKVDNAVAAFQDRSFELIGSQTTIGGYTVPAEFQNAGYYYMELTAAEVDTALDLGSNAFELNNVDAWTAFRTELFAGKLMMRVAPVAP